MKFPASHSNTGLSLTTCSLLRHLLPTLLVAVLLAMPCAATAQPAGCNSDLKGSDKSDFERGVEAYNNKRFDLCIKLMKGVSAHRRDAADPYFYLAAASARGEGKPGIVQAYLKRLFKVCPDYPNALAYYYQGLVDYTYQHYDEALRNLNRFFDMANEQPNPAYDAVYEEASSYLYWSEFLAEAYENQVPFNPQVLLQASTKADEMLPYLTHDGNELYFLRAVAEKDKNTFYSKQFDEKKLLLYVSRRKKDANGEWATYTAGEPLPAPFNQSGEEGSVCLTADGKVLYYSILTHENGYANCDLWYTERQGGVWQPLKNAGKNVNGERTWESQPTLTPDGQYLYFVSNRPGGMGGTDIWRCRRLPNGDWSRAENLGASVNTQGDEKFPYMHADGHTLYFASNGWQGFGGYDMYFIDLADPSREYPTNLGLPVNSEQDDICFGVSADGKRAYFAGRATENYTGVGGGDIFTFELYPAAQPEEMSVVHGTLKTKEGAPLSGIVSVLRQHTEADRYLVAADGQFAVALSVRGSNTVIATSEGCLPMVFCGNATQLARDISSTDFSLLHAELWGRYPLRLPKGQRFVTGNATQTGVTSDADRTFSTILDAYVDFLLEHPRMRLRIEAPRLEEAQAIRDYFVSRQLRAERFEYKSNVSLAAPQIVITEM